MKDSNERVTPDQIFQPLDDLVDGFDWDLAANGYNTKKAYWFGPDSDFGVDALAVPSWTQTIAEVFAPHNVRMTAWCNPPYGKENGGISAWCERAWLESTFGLTTYMLLPADTSTRWYREWVQGTEYYVYAGRGKFKGAPLNSKGKLAGAKFGSFLKIFRPPLPEKWGRP